MADRLFVVLGLALLGLLGLVHVDPARAEAYVDRARAAVSDTRDDADEGNLVSAAIELRSILNARCEDQFAESVRLDKADPSYDPANPVLGPCHIQGARPQELQP